MKKKQNKKLKQQCYLMTKGLIRILHLLVFDVHEEIIYVK